MFINSRTACGGLTALEFDRNAKSVQLTASGAAKLRLAYTRKESARELDRSRSTTLKANRIAIRWSPLQVPFDDLGTGPNLNRFLLQSLLTRN